MTLHHGNIPREFLKVPGQCKVCGDVEPFHVHSREARIENYFIVGRNQTAFEAAVAWKRKYLELLNKS